MKTLIAAAVTAAALATTALSGTAEAATSKRVVFESQGQRLVGDLYLPDGYKPGDRLPAVIVTGAWMTVKEQMPARYAAELADRGFAALAFDFRGWGQSEGAVRNLESPVEKTRDIVAAAAYLATRPEIDATRIGGLGICASAGYMADAVAGSPNLRSLALVAPWLHDRALVDQVYGGREGVAKLVAVGRDAAERQARTGQAVTLPAASKTDRSAVMFDVPYYTERDRGLIPEWDNRFNLASWEGWLGYDAIAIAPKLGTKPAAIVHSEAAAIPDGAKRFHAALTGPKTQLWLKDVGQLDFYDRDQLVRQAADFVADHFRTTLR
ncbi:MAG TPA: CocE/NonD family hydrolase [Azospirillaceae bacterium]|nr:CocE/NonD family hydrolase [Azospirillaceae bacterium]